MNKIIIIIIIVINKSILKTRALYQMEMCDFFPRVKGDEAWKWPLIIMLRWITVFSFASIALDVVKASSSF